MCGKPATGRGAPAGDLEDEIRTGLERVDAEDAAWLVAIHGSRKIGMAFGDLISGEVNVRIWIHPDYRKQGYGTAVLRKSRSEMAAYFPAVPLVVRAPAAGVLTLVEINVLQGVSRTFSAIRGFRCAPPRWWGLEFVTSAPMATSVSRLLALLMVAALGFTVGPLTACTPKPNGPEPTAEQFFAALATGDTAAAAELSDRPADARQALNNAWAGLQATHLDAQILSSKYAEDTGSVAYRYTWHLPKDRTWTYDGQLNMVRNEGRWEVRWSATGVHPKLGENQTLALRADPPRRASVNERGGTDVLVPGYLYSVSLDARAAAGSLMTTSRAVVDALRPFDNTLDPQRLAEQASSSKRPMYLITLRQSDHDRVAAAVGSLPGVVITPQAELLPTDETFAPAIIGEVKKAVVDELDGQAGWRVVSVNQNGVDVDVLNEVPADPAPSVTISLDRAVQDAAQNAVNTTGKQAMIVAIKPSTGEILAVAQNAAGRRAGAHSPRRGSTRRDRRSRWSRRAPRSNATWQHPIRCCPAPAPWTSATAPSPITAASTSAPCRCRGRSPVRATPPSPNWPAGCRRAG